MSPPASSVGCRCSSQAVRACFDMEVLLCSTVCLTLLLLLPSTCGEHAADRHSQGLSFKTHSPCAVLTAPLHPNFSLLECVSTVLPDLFWEIFCGNKGLGLHSYQIRQIHTLFKNVWTFDTVFIHPGVTWPCISNKWPSQFLSFFFLFLHFFFLFLSLTIFFFSANAAIKFWLAQWGLCAPR